MNPYLEQITRLAASIARECGYLANDAENVVSRMEGGVRLESNHRKAAIDAFASSIKSTSCPEDIAKKFRKTFRKQPHTLTACIDTMFRIFVSEKKLRKTADKHIKKVAEVFQFPLFEYQKLKARHLGIAFEESSAQFGRNGNGKNSINLAPLYAQLDCAPGATLREVKKAYRQLALIYHPDKTKGLEISPEVQNDLYLRFQEIKSAYETLIKQLEIQRD